jgi:predicted ATPase/DNA-binding SARP family transcriptional activator/Tfp pilus assembly protein PilF
MAWVRVEFFAGLRVWVKGQPVLRFRTQKTASLLAYLAYHLDRLHPRELLADMFWGESEPEQARNSLSKALSSLRQQLTFPDSVSVSPIYSDRFHVGFRSEHVSTDVSEFESHLRAAQTARSVHERISHLSNAIQLYRGELLPDFSDEWVEVERARRAEQFSQAVHEIVNLYERMGELEQALHFARLGLKFEPFSETFCEQVMRLLLASNQPAEALKEFREFSRRLEANFGNHSSLFSTRLTALAKEAEQKVSSSQQQFQTLGVLCVRSEVQPLIGTVTLLTFTWKQRGKFNFPQALREIVSRHSGQIVKSENSFLAAVFPCAYWAVECAFDCCSNLPEDSLRCFVDTVDLTGAEQLSDLLRQLRQSIAFIEGNGRVICSETTRALLKRSQNNLALLSSFAPSEPQKVQGDLPPTQKFFGRKEELAQLRKWLLDEGTRLVSIVGIGGSGKTHLALEFGHRSWDEYEGAVWFVPLQDAKGFETLSELLARALKLPISPEQPVFERAVQFLSSVHGLLILDGIEGALPEGEFFVREILKRAPKVQCLVTSRRPLGLTEERVMTLMPLPVPEVPDGEASANEIDELSKCPSIQMFVDRARKFQPDFRLTERTAKKVASICARLEGIPLAIELAASWLSSMSLSQILERLEQPMIFLRTSRRDIPERHRSLQLVLANSWQMLPEPMKKVLTTISVFRGGALPDAVAFVSGLPEELLDQVRCWGLVCCGETPSGEPRFWLLDTIREFVNSQMVDEERRNLRKRSAQFFVELAEGFNGGAGKSATEWASWLQRMDWERDNLRETLTWATVNEPELALRLLKAAQPFWQLRWSWQEVFGFSKSLFNSVTDAPTSIRADAAILVGEWAVACGDFELASSMGKTALKLFAQIGDALGQGKANLLLSEIAYLRGNYRDARQHAETSIAFFKAQENLRQQATAEFTLGRIFFRQGDMERSQFYYTRCLKTFEALGDEYWVASAKSGLASIAWRECLYKVARSLYESALNFWRTVSPEHTAALRSDLGLIALFMGNYDEARQHYEAARAIRASLGARSEEAAALNGIASVAWRQGHLDEAERLYSQALEVFREIGNRWCVALTLMDLGNVALLLGKTKQARELLSQSLSEWEKLGDRWGIAKAMQKLGVAALSDGKEAKALSCLMESLRLSEAIGDKIGVAETMESLAELAYRLNEPSVAVQLLAAASKIRRKIFAPLPPVLESKWNKFVDGLRTALGQTQFKVEWQKGQAIPIDHIAQTLVKRQRSRSLPVSVGSNEISASLR